LPKVEIERTEQLTKKQLKSLLDVLHADGGQVSKLMELAVYTGMRRNEMFNLKWENVNFEHVFIRIMNNKSGKNPTIPMNQAARAVLKSMDETTEFVFQEIQGHSGSWILNRANMLKARAGLPDDFRPFHGMRHAFASLLVSEGVQLYQVSQLLTHRNLQMTQRYSHLSDESKQAATNVLDDILNGV
jgi:integrase